MSRIFVILSVAAMSAALWWFRSVSADYMLFADLTFTRGLDIAASLATALLIVLLAGHVVVRLMLVSVDGVDANGFQRVSVYALLTLAACAAVLAHLGVNVTAVFATSAILTAVLGLALQPTLGGLIGGLTLHTDRVLRVGDAILQNGDYVEITAFSWRSVAGRKNDGSLVVFPNARILDTAIEILPADRPVRAETSFVAPIRMAPQLLSDLVGQLVADFAEVNDEQPVVVAPVSFDPEKALAHYRVRYWINATADRSGLDGEILRGVWYALQREGLKWPSSMLYDAESTVPHGPADPLAHDWPSLIEAAIAQAPPHPDLAGIKACPAPDIARAGVPLCYAASERIALPSRVRGHVCLLVKGTVYEVTSAFDTLHRPRRVSGTVEHSLGAEQLSPRAKIKRISDILADAIGPYAEIAVRRAAGNSAGADEIRAIVADEISDPVRKRAFLAATVAPAEHRHGPGLIVYGRHDATGNPMPNTLLRAADACTLIAIPPDILDTGRAAGDVLSPVVRSTLRPHDNR